MVINGRRRGLCRDVVPRRSGRDEKNLVRVSLARVIDGPADRRRRRRARPKYQTTRANFAISFRSIRLAARTMYVCIFIYRRNTLRYITCMYVHICIHISSSG